MINIPARWIVQSPEWVISLSLSLSADAGQTIADQDLARVSPLVHARVIPNVGIFH